MESNEKIVWLKRSVLEKIVEDLKQWYPKETGGVLIGYWNQNQAVITNIIDGGPKALRKEVSFTPDHAYQKKEIEKVYNSTGRTEVYLGDWHSHPDSYSYMSWRDKKTLKKIANFKNAGLIHPMMMIIGTSPPELKVWLYEKQKLFYPDLIRESQLHVFDDQ